MANGHGGKRANAGRPRKSEEQEIIERMKIFSPLAMDAIEKGLKKGNVMVLKMWLQYVLGNPKQMVEAQVNADDLTKSVLEFIKIKDDE